jgi:UDP-N-acetylmuramoyl-tripeptide--D-alanyl-D-alanine ligase
VLGLVLFSYKRLLRYLRFLQQDDYSNDRFYTWLFQHRAFDTRASLMVVTAWIASVIAGEQEILFALLGIGLIICAYREHDPRRLGKKRLVLTKRAALILRVAMTVSFLLILLVILGWWYRASWFWIVLLTVAQCPPWALMIAVSFLKPHEQRVQQQFMQEAREKIKRIAPFTIGVTGSFGKTSVKNMLGEILSMSLGPTFYPQAGVNTEMGITREIRERLSASHRYAVIEMGAYHEGSIARLCRLTPVNAAIVTAVHLMHLERFGGVEQVYRAKSELPQALGGKGILVLNGDNRGARAMADQFAAPTTLLYGLDFDAGRLDAKLRVQETTRLGTQFVVEWQGRSLSGFTKMHGRGALSNLLASFTMAVALGADPETVLAVARNLEPVSHRLEVKDHGGYIQINDAYNSNPEGFRYALEVLRDLPGTRRILITPGMIELGDRQYEENRKIAQFAASVCDQVFVVNEINRDALCAGLRQGGMGEGAIHYFERRDQALEQLTAMRAVGDIVLLENDLPDLHEFTEKF